MVHGVHAPSQGVDHKLQVEVSSTHGFHALKLSRGVTEWAMARMGHTNHLIAVKQP